MAESRPRHSPIALVIALATALGLGLRIYLLLRPGYLLGVTQYDDGEYFGSALRLADGFLPYRDFVLVQPPGITLLLAPLGLLGRAVGTQSAFVIARLLTVCVGTASVPLGGLLVRHRGTLAVATACGILAVYPDAIGASYTVFLEPYLVLFCLLGALAVFEGDRLSGASRRLFWGGVAFGFAGAIKVWAIFPVLVVLALLWRPGSLRRVSHYVLGVIAGFCIPVVPFFVLAPGAFYDDVIGAQLHQTDVARVSVASRFYSLFGLVDLSPANRHAVAAGLVIVLLTLAVSLAASLLTRLLPPPLECFALGSTALLLVAFMLPMDYFSHYAAFFAPFLALSVALPLARLVDALSAGRARPPLRTWLPAATLALAAVAIVGIAIRQFDQERPLKAAGAPTADARAIPPGACVLTDNASFTIAADRFLSGASGCSLMVDALGTDMGLSHGRNPLTGADKVAAVQATWLSALRHAQYVWLNCGPPRATVCNRFTNRRVPWTAPILSYFEEHFRAIPRVPGFLYVRVD
jgi:alpha-1,2-mannosyltransferase